MLLLSSILLVYWRTYNFPPYCADMEVKQINKRASGQAFELILKPPSPVSEAPRTLASPKKKELSLEEIQKKLEAAEERRKVSFLRKKKMLVIRHDLVYRIAVKFPVHLCVFHCHHWLMVACIDKNHQYFSRNEWVYFLSAACKQASLVSMLGKYASQNRDSFRQGPGGLKCACLLRECN